MRVGFRPRRWNQENDSEMACKVGRSVGAWGWVLGVLVAASLVTGCKKKSDESDEPLKLPEKKTEASADATASAAPSASATAAASAAPAESGSAASSAAAAPSTAPTTAPTPEPATSGAVAMGGGQGIDKCCAAINAIQSTGVSKETKTKASAAAAACGGISQLVKTGRTSRASALTQVKASLAGASVPAACN